MAFRKLMVTIIVPLLTFFIMELAASVLPSALHYFLSIDDRPQKASVVVVLCGGSGSRALHGAALIESGYADKLILAGTNGEITFVKTILKKWNQRMGQKDLVVAYEIRNTVDSAKLISDLAGKCGDGKLIIVSSGWHLRRVRALVFAEASVWWNSQFSFSAVPYEKDPIIKLSHLKKRDFILIETIKYLHTLAMIRYGWEPI